MKKFIRKTLLMFMPFVYLLIIYCYMDPFKVLYDYENFYEHTDKGYINLNKDFVSTETYCHNREKEKYNAFIFGNSRSIFYHISEWKKYIGDEARGFHFDASGETLFGIYKKVQFIGYQGDSIKNALLILDHETLKQDKPRRGHLYVPSPKLLHYRNVLLFHAENFMAFLSPKFMYAYLDYRFSGLVKDYMKEEFLLLDIPVKYEVTTNELRFPFNDERLAKNTYYTPQLIRDEFYTRDKQQHYSEACIRENQQAMLSDIAASFRKYGTRFRIIINPLYNQEKLNPADLAYLEQLFGKEQVFDYSGINPITDDYRNYYEKSHYRPEVADAIMKFMYTGVRDAETWR